jgi:hypothetical protein
LQAFYLKFMWRAAPHSSPLLWCTQGTPPSLLCVLFSSLFIIQIFFQSRVSLPTGLCCFYPRGGFESIMHHLFAHLFFWVSQEGLEPASGGAGALLVSLCNVEWRSIVWAGVQGIRVLLLLGGFFLQVWLQCLSKIFDLWSSCCLLPPCSCHLGSLP